MLASQGLRNYRRQRILRAKACNFGMGTLAVAFFVDSSMTAIFDDVVTAHIVPMGIASDISSGGVMT